MRFIGILLSILVVLSSRAGLAYMVGPAKNLQEVTAESDVVIKAKVLETTPTVSDLYNDLGGFGAQSTALQIISLIKGDLPTTRPTFIHYATKSGYAGGRFYMPQFYDLAADKNYLIFAKFGQTSDTLIQIWNNHTQLEDQGAFNCAVAEPVSSGTIEEIVWDELIKLLKTRDENHVVYAIRHLDQMSRKVHDFPREKVIETVASYIADNNSTIASAAIKVIGGGGFYLSADGPGFFREYSDEVDVDGLNRASDTPTSNPTAVKYRDGLIAVADTHTDNAVRALAVRALGHTQTARDAARMGAWLKDSDEAVRAAATLLLAEADTQFAVQLLPELAKDEAAGVRIAAAQAVAFGRINALIPVLGGLINDGDDAVRRAAGQSLVSFSPTTSGEVLKANLSHKEFRASFVNALAAKDPKPYLNDLAEIIEKQLGNDNFWGGRTPVGVSWQLLFEYAKQLDAEALKQKETGIYLDALERMKWHSSSEPRDLYEFYIKSGMLYRARKFRQACKPEVGLNLEYFFEQVDPKGLGKP